MSAEVTSPHAIDDETLAAFADGRLDEHERAVVRAHLGSCAECRDTLNLIAGAQDEDIIPRQATVIRGGRFRRYAPWMAAAAAAVVILYLPPVRERVDDYRTGGVSSLQKDYEHANQRKVQARLTGFPYKHFKGPTRSASTPESDDKEGPLTSATLQLQIEIPEDTTSVRKLRALAFAYLLDPRREKAKLDKAVTLMERAVQLAGEPNASLLSDLSASYLERARFTGDEKSDGTAALRHAQRAWTMEKTPEIAWNLALAYQDLDRNDEAIIMWNEYLKLDPSSPWADEVRTEHLPRLKDPF